LPRGLKTQLANKGKIPYLANRGKNAYLANPYFANKAQTHILPIRAKSLKLANKLKTCPINLKPEPEPNPI